ncbi:RNA-directed DNA polymerase, eukaryota, reverse transcriptase zinc-binding domain protein [Tanacetum coccineum]
MRSKRTIKPTKIFDNFVSSSSRNTNKHKIDSKKSRDDSVSMNETVEYDGNSNSMSNNLMKINGVERGNSVEFKENVFNVSIEEEIKESKKEEHVENSVNNEIEDTGVKQGNKEGKTGNRSVDERIGNGNINGTENGNYVSGNGVSHGKNGKTQNVEVRSNMDTGVERRRNTDVIMEDGPNAGNNTPSSTTPGKFSNHSKEGISLNYAKSLTKNISDGGNQLFSVPAGLNSKGEEVVLFDEEIVREGSEKWQFTVCGFFVGCKMHVNKLRCNTRRMWGRYGLKDIVVDANNMCFFKFKDKEGMNYIIEQSPWIINLLNVPLEAWSIKGINAISSRLGRPLMMDKITSEMCKAGSGRLGFARVLVEVDVSKEFLEKNEINYVDGQEKVKMSKWVRVDYSWKPDRCSHYKVFGHSVNYCKAKPVIETEKTTGKNTSNMGGNREGFVEVKNRKNRFGNYGGMNNGVQGNKQNYQRNNQTQVKFAFQQKMPNTNPSNVEQNVNRIEPKNQSSNVLSEEDNEGLEVDPFIDSKLIVDEFVKKKQQPSCNETKGWTYDMINCFKYAWESMERKEKEFSDDEDALENINQAVHDTYRGRKRKNTRRYEA